MEWFRVESSVYDHPKMEGLSSGAFRALVFGWAYVARHETGGHLPESARRRIGLTSRYARELEERGLLHRNGSGWLIHDWADYQIDAAEMRERRERRREQWRESKRRARQEGRT